MLFLIGLLNSKWFWEPSGLIFPFYHCLPLPLNKAWLSQFALCVCIVQGNPDLELPEERTTGLGCIPEGSTVSYQCTVSDTSNPLIGSTLWNGTAFHCPLSSNQINLPHIQFTNMLTASCGTLTATSLKVIGNNYVSQLSLTATMELNGRTLLCSLGGLAIIGSDVIPVGGWCYMHAYTHASTLRYTICIDYISICSITYCVCSLHVQCMLHCIRTIQSYWFG